MKKRYIIAFMTAVFMLLHTVAYAETNLKDISNHWAEKEIKQMVEKKFILGYPDGTFKPDNSVTKLDALIMASRILGVDETENAEEVITAQEASKTVMASYNIYGKREVSYLYNKKLFTKAELDSYLKGENAKTYIKRYEAAILFTKIMGKESEVKNKTFLVLPFMDSAQIPAMAKPYVEFMSNQEIMKGITKTEFMPNNVLTRAQVALLLLRVSNKIEGVTTDSTSTTIGADATFIGTVDFISNDTKLLVVKNASNSKSYTLLTSTPIRIDNVSSTFGSLERGMNVTIKTKGIEVLEVIAASRTYSKTITGIISSISSSTPLKIGIKEDVDDTDSDKYEVDDYVNISRNGSYSSTDGLNIDDYGTIYILANGKIGKVVVENRDKTVSGTVVSLTTDDEVNISVKSSSETKKYEVLSDVEVTRNGKSSSLKEVKAGDSVKLSLRYNKVRQIKAESDSKTAKGIIQEILIGKTSKITIKDGSKTETYEIASTATIKVDGNTSEIYDLRLGTSVDLDLESNVAVVVKAEKKVETLEVRGTISLINLSLGVITIESDAGEATQVYVDKSTKVNDIIEGTTMKLSELEKDQKIIAYGKSDRGVFVTSLIIVTE